MGMDIQKGILKRFFSEVSTRTNLQDLFLDMGMDKGILKQGMKVLLNCQVSEVSIFMY